MGTPAAISSLDCLDCPFDAHLPYLLTVISALFNLSREFRRDIDLKGLGQEVQVFLDGYGFDARYYWHRLCRHCPASLNVKAEVL
jgi:hypothetical protein